MRILAIVATSVVLSGCMTGPNYLGNKVGDARNNSYADSPVGTAVITDVLPIYPLLSVLAWVPDTLIINPIQFWGFDVWSGKGAGFKHKNPRRGATVWVEELAQGDSPASDGDDRLAGDGTEEPGVARPASASK